MSRVANFRDADWLLDRAVGDLVVERPSRARVFESVGIDYCCGGRKALRQACRDARRDPFEVLARIDRHDQRTAHRVATEPDWSRAALSDLIEHIEQHHHDYLRHALPRIDRLTENVALAQGARDGRLTALRQAFLSLKDELEPHLQREEAAFFPFCRALELAARTGGDVPRTLCGETGDDLAEVLAMEHDDAGHLLAHIRDLADDFVPPSDASNTYQAMLHALAELEADLHQHMHLENNVLFPRALALEAKLGR